MDAPRQVRIESDALAVELEVAMRRILGRQAFAGDAEMYVSPGAGADGPYYFILIDSRAARVVAQFLNNPPHLRINSNPVIWTFDQARAEAIVAAASK